MPIETFLGPGESGKSTIFKQMKIIQLNGGYSQEELENYRYIIYGNCVTQMKVLVSAANALGIPLDSDDNRVNTKISKLKPEPTDRNEQSGY